MQYPNSYFESNVGKNFPLKNSSNPAKSGEVVRHNKTSSYTHKDFSLSLNVNMNKDPTWYRTQLLGT
jgi:hypothetical protein